MGDKEALEIMKEHGMTPEEAEDALKGIKEGVKDVYEGRVIPWSQVKKELGLKELELTKEEYVAKYPVGTRILWSWNKTWLPGVVIESRKKHPAWDPSVWFILGRDNEPVVNIDYSARFVGYKYQHLIKLEG